ncbi:MAG TPA: hypothetical protein VD846_11610 [Allosphingosinicella sp.]|nr:hypothetical protein [Allosphingosinicella sp.]
MAAEKFTARGAFIQLVPGLGVFQPNIVLFQYNPAKITRALTPWDPFQASPSKNGVAAPDVSPYPAEEKINFELLLNDDDPSQVKNPMHRAFGLAPRIAALRKLIKPSAGLGSDLLQSALQIAGAKSKISARPTVPITFLSFGASFLLPVKLTALTIEETLFTRALFPIHAKATVALQVLTPNLFRCKEDRISALAVKAYQINEMKDDAAALANVVNTGFDVAGLF